MPRKTFLAIIIIIIAASMFPLGGMAQWAQNVKRGDTAYFLFGTSPRLERYALASREWLSTINLPTVYGPATAFAVDADSIYVAYGQSVKRYDLSGGNEVHIVNTAEAVQGIFVDGNVIFLNRSGSLYARVTSINKTDNSIIATFENYIDAVSGASIAPGINKIFGRSLGVSPSDITFVSYNDNGTFVNGGDSPHHGAYPSASRTWVFPDGAKVVDDSGTVYSTGNLAYINSFGGSITDLDFYGSNVPIVLRGTQLIAYSNALLPTGSQSLGYAPKNIYIAGADVLTFTFDVGQATGIRVDSVSLSALNPPSPGQPVDPKGLAYTPDAIFLDKNGILYLFSKAHQSLFRWDTLGQAYISTIPLVGSPSHVAYSAQNHKVYLAYSTGLIRQIDLNTTDFLETPFVNLPSSPLGLAAVDPYIFAVDGSGAWDTHYTFDASGVQADSVDWNYYSTEYIWSSVRQKLYFFRDDTSPNDLLWEEINADGGTYIGKPPGEIGGKIDSPLHDSAGFAHPIRVSPDGTVVVLGSGVIHDAVTLSRLATGLGNSITDAAWVDGHLRTIRTISGLSQLQQWTLPNYGLGSVRQLPGTALRLMELGPDRLLAISLLNGVPSFYVLNGNFSIIAPPSLSAPDDLNASIVSTSQINLAWQDVNGEESYTIERKSGVGGSWSEIGTATTGSTSYTDSTVVTGNQYYYRVIARNGGQSSPTSSEVSAALVMPATPMNVSALKLSSTSIQITWDDVPFETMYYLEQKTGAAGAWSQIATFAANTVVVTNNGLTPYTQYYYRIRAGNAIGMSGYSSSAGAITDPVLPATPVLTSASAAGPFVVDLVWSDVSYEDGYVIERRLGSNGVWGYLDSVAANSTGYSDGSVAPSTTYEYRLYAVNVLGPTANSNTRAVTTPQIPAPSTPVGLSAKALSSDSVMITWGDVSFESGYRLERRTENLNSWTVIATLPANSTSFTSTGLTNNTQYWFRVQAYNAYGNSPYSNEDDAVPMEIVDLLADDFDPDLNTGFWARILGGVARTGSQGFLGGNALYFSANGSRLATTIPLDVSLGGSIQFFMRAGNEGLEGNEFWNNSEIGENVVLEYSKDGGLSWVPIQTLETVYPSLSGWTSFSITIPIAAFGPNTQFQWRQLSNSGFAFDCWALDDLVIQGAAPQLPLPVPFVISSASSSTAISVFWIGVERASSYVVERKTGIGSWVSVGMVPQSITYYTDTGLKPGTAYSYRIQAVNAGGAAAYSTATSSYTWSQIQQWIADNYGSLDALDLNELISPAPDGSRPLLRYAFNLGSDEPQRFLEEGQSSGYPAIGLDSTHNRLCVEFVRRKASTNPGITYRVEFTDDLSTWTVLPNPVSTVDIDPVWERVRYEDTVTPHQASRRYFRVTVQP